MKCNFVFYGFSGSKWQCKIVCNNMAYWFRMLCKVPCKRAYCQYYTVFNCIKSALKQPWHRNFSCVFHGKNNIGKPKCQLKTLLFYLSCRTLKIPKLNFPKQILSYAFIWALDQHPDLHSLFIILFGSEKKIWQHFFV